MNPTTTTMADTKRPDYRVSCGDPITAWVAGPLIEQYYPGVPAPAEDRVDYRFINGFVDVGDLPCRKAFLADMVGRPITPPTSWETATLLLPSQSRHVEFTNFWHVPTHVSRWLRGTIRTQAHRQVPFRLKTCGGVCIWVNGQEQARFEPFRRNTESQADIVLSLSAGDNDILVFTEDLAERDTVWFFELELRDEQPVDVLLPVEIDRNEVERLEAIISSIRPAQDLFIGEPLRMLFDKAPGKDLPVSIEIQSHGHEKAVFCRADLVLGAGEKELLVPNTHDMPAGYHGVKATIGSKTATVSRTISAGFMPDLGPLPSLPTLVLRKKEALHHSAAFGAARIGTVLAMLACGGTDERRLGEILDATLASIDRREDCSDFVMVPLLWILADHGDQLSADRVALIKESVLGYRYWVDEPGNDTMWFWSENHVLCFHVSQLLAGQLLPDEIFSASGRTGRQQAEIATARLHRWFDSVEAHGLAEWNSAAYYPVDFIGLLALHHLAKASIAARAEHQLDLIFHMIALHSLHGVPAGSQGRAYDKELRAGPLTELAPFARVAFGTGWLNAGVASLPMFAAGSYEPPVELSAYAQLAAGRCIEAQYAQGLEGGKLVLFKTSASQLSTVVDHKTGLPGHQQHVLDIKLSGHPMARLWINHPGEDDPWGSQRPSFWAGNGILPRVAQHRDVALMIFDTRTGRLPWTHAYVPAGILDEVLLLGNWLIARSGEGFAALHATNGLRWIEQGPTADTEIRSEGAVAGWVAVIGAGDELAFAQFVEQVLAIRVDFDPTARRLSVTHPTRGDITLDHDGDFRVRGQQRAFCHTQPEPRLTYASDAMEAGEAPYFNGEDAQG